MASATPGKRRHWRAHPSPMRSWRMGIWEETLAALQAMRFRSGVEPRDMVELDGEKVKAWSARSHLVDESFLAHGAGELADRRARESGDGEHALAVAVVNADCLDAALVLAALGFSPLLLNMASDKHAGGGVRSGAGAQEENLFRRTSLAMAMWPAAQGGVDKARPFRYPLGECQAIYCPRAWALRGRESAGYPWLASARPFASIALPGYRRPGLDAAGRLDAATQAGLAKKVRLLLRVAQSHGHDALVLSAIGCGAFRNPPADVARVIRDTLVEEGVVERRGDAYRVRPGQAVRIVVFAIIEDHNSRAKHNPLGNVRPFADAFGAEPVTLSGLLEACADAPGVPAAGVAAARADIAAWDHAEAQHRAREREGK